MREVLAVLPVRPKGRNARWSQGEFSRVAEGARTSFWYWTGKQNVRPVEVTESAIPAARQLAESWLKYFRHVAAHGVDPLHMIGPQLQETRKRRLKRDQTWFLRVEEANGVLRVMSGRQALNRAGRGPRRRQGRFTTLNGSAVARIPAEVLSVVGAGRDGLIPFFSDLPAFYFWCSRQPGIRVTKSSMTDYSAGRGVVIRVRAEKVPFYIWEPAPRRQRKPFLRDRAAEVCAALRKELEALP
jgi:hypothetical protein